MSKTNLYDVLISGGGPVGMALGGDLLRRGIKVRIVDKAEGPSTLSKAVVLMPRMLEEFQLRGLAGRIMEHVQPMRRWAAYAEGKLVLESNFSKLPTRYNFLACIPQNITEQILRDYLTEQGGEVEYRTELLSFEDKGDRIVSKLRHANGEIEEVESLYLCGADGAHSTVRHGLGLEFHGAQYPDIWALGDVKISWDYPHDHANTFFHEEGFIATFPMPEGRTRIFAVGADQRVMGSETTLEQLQSFIDRWSFVKGRVSDPRWLSQFHVHHRTVDSYREGRVFICGDAAHIHSPLTGLGMNSGIQDAYNLGWKLALLLKDEAEDELLDSYHTERHAVGLDVVSTSHTVHTIWAQFGQVGELLRNRAFELFNQLYNIYYKPVEEQCQMAIDYRKIDHSIVLDYKHGATGISLGQFAVAGRRALDSHVLRPLPDGSTEATSLYDVFSGSPKHHALIFTGMRSEKADLDRAYGALQLLRKWDPLVRPLWVSSRDIPPPDSNVDWLYDVTLESHATYGAERTAMFLIRPDGYIGMRVLPIDPKPIELYLGRYYRTS